MFDMFDTSGLCNHNFTDYNVKESTDFHATAYPIICLFTKWYNDTTPLGTMVRNRHFVVAHSGFFMFNLINVCCILMFYGYVLSLLRKNVVMWSALLACAVQMCSCLCSIHRYNTNDEMGAWAHTSVWTGLIAYSFFNYAILHIALNRHRNKSIGLSLFGNSIGPTDVGLMVWVCIAGACWCHSEKHWEVKNFSTFRLYITLSTGFQLLAYLLLFWELRSGRIGMPENHCISNEKAKRVVNVAIGLIVVSFLCAMSACPIFQYPATGMTFSVMVIVVALFGEIVYIPVAEAVAEDNNSEGHTPVVAIAAIATEEAEMESNNSDEHTPVVATAIEEDTHLLEGSTKSYGGTSPV